MIESNRARSRPRYRRKQLERVRTIPSRDRELAAIVLKYDPRLEAPVYFLLGRHDYNTPFELAERYFHQLQAPQKELIWFENSAYAPIFEEPEKFNEVMREKVRPATE